MPSTLRVPKAEPRGLYAAVVTRYARRAWGQVPDTLYVLWHHRPALKEGLAEAKVREVPRWRESEVFTDLERDVMAYAEAMTATPPAVTDAMVHGLTELHRRVRRAPQPAAHRRLRAARLRHRRRGRSPGDLAAVVGRRPGHGP